MTPTEQTAFNQMRDALEKIANGKMFNFQYRDIAAKAIKACKQALEAAKEVQEKPQLLANGKPLLEFGLEELFEFQEATGCDTADEYRAQMRPQASEPKAQAQKTKHVPTIDLNKYAGTYGGYTK